MNKIGAYYISVENKLIVIYLSGYIDIDDLIYLQNVMHLNPTFNAYFDVIIDFRDSIPVANEQDIKRYIEFMKMNSQYFRNRKGAYLTSKPNEVVATTLFSILLNDIPIKTMIFSSIEPLRIGTIIKILITNLLIMC